MNFMHKTNTEVAEAIRMAALSRLSVFTQTDITNLIQFDDMELDLIGDRKTAVFITLHSFNHSLNFLSSVLITQIFNALFVIYRFFAVISLTLNSILTMAKLKISVSR